MLHPSRRDDLMPALMTLARSYLEPAGYDPAEVRGSASVHPDADPQQYVQLRVWATPRGDRLHGPAWEFGAKGVGPDDRSAFVALTLAIEQEFQDARTRLAMDLERLTRTRETFTKVLLDTLLTTRSNGID
jgi:hypothetical protein